MATSDWFCVYGFENPQSLRQAQPGIAVIEVDLIYLYNS